MVVLDLLLADVSGGICILEFPLVNYGFDDVTSGISLIKLRLSY